MLKSLNILACLFLVLSVSGQTETGFYGKRFTIQLGAGAHHNTLLKLASRTERSFLKSDYYRNYRKQTGTNPFNYSFYTNMGVILKEHLVLSIDFQYYFGKIFFRDLGIEYHDSPYPGGGYYYTSKYDCLVNYNTVRLMPRIEISSQNSNAPSGLTHILALGIEVSQLKSGNYTCIDSNYNGTPFSPDSIQINTDYIRLGTENAFNVTLMYGMEYRIPLSKSIAWNLGGYLHANLPVLFPSYSDDSPYSTSERDQHRKLALHRFQNLFSLRTGLVVML